MKFDNTNTGVLFKSTFKRNDKSPDYIGTLNVQGKEWTIFGRIKKSKAGKSFMSLSIAEPTKKDGPNDDVPFDDEINF